MNGLRVRAAGAQEIVRPRRLIERFWATSPLERMRTATLAAVAMFEPSGPAASSPAPAELPQGQWDLRVCEGSVSKGSTCAHVAQDLKLQVKYLVGRADGGKQLFEQTISHSLARQLYGLALSLIRSFGEVPAGSTDEGADALIVQLKANGHEATVVLRGVLGTANAAPDAKALVDLLGQLTHAF